MADCLEQLANADNKTLASWLDNVFVLGWRKPFEDCISHDHGEPETGDIVKLYERADETLQTRIDTAMATVVTNFTTGKAGAEWGHEYSVKDKPLMFEALLYIMGKIGIVDLIVEPLTELILSGEYKGVQLNQNWNLHERLLSILEVVDFIPENLVDFCLEGIRDDEQSQYFERYFLLGALHNETIYREGFDKYMTHLSGLSGSFIEEDRPQCVIDMGLINPTAYEELMPKWLEGQNDTPVIQEMRTAYKTAMSKEIEPNL